MIATQHQPSAEAIAAWLEQHWRPRFQADGGDIMVGDWQTDGTLEMIARGECARCHLTDGCVKQFLEAKIREQFGTSVTLRIKRVQPYFWDR
ncbi:MAG: NifU family protein [Lentisphaerae bacterium]|nr:MAG: NifU family protein [Lentisphaerota bacterium]